MDKKLLKNWRYSEVHERITTSLPGSVVSSETICKLDSGRSEEERKSLSVLLLNTPEMFELLTTFMKVNWYRQPVQPSLTVECKVCGEIHSFDSSLIHHKTDCMVGNTEALLEKLNNA